MSIDEELYGPTKPKTIYWTSKRSGVTVRFRAYRIREVNESYSLLARKPVAEVYIFLTKENHGSCFGMIKGDHIRHFKSKDDAFKIISNTILNEAEKE